MTVLNDIKTSDTGGGPPTDLRHMASQTVFSVLDHLTKWTRHRMTEIAIQSVPTNSTSKTASSVSGMYMPTNCLTTGPQPPTSPTTPS